MKLLFGGAIVLTLGAIVLLLGPQATQADCSDLTIGLGTDPGDNGVDCNNCVQWQVGYVTNNDDITNLTCVSVNLAASFNLCDPSLAWEGGGGGSQCKYIGASQTAYWELWATRKNWNNPASTAKVYISFPCSDQSKYVYAGWAGACAGCTGGTSCSTDP